MSAKRLVYRTVGMMDVALNFEAGEGQCRRGKKPARRIEEYAVECSILKVWGSEMIDYVA